MKIISTNVATSKTVIYNGKEVKTAIFKQPVQQAVAIERLSIVGDEQADLVFHGGEHKAVYAFSADHYSYWQSTLNNENLACGSFGENFTVTGLSEADISIGDRLRFGSALLEVSQPRVPCFKLGIALDNKDAVKLFTKSYLTGVYFRVIEEGTAKTGDAVTFEKKAADSVSVKELFRAYFDRSYRENEQVFIKALALEALAPEWKEKLVKRLSTMEP